MEDWSRTGAHNVAGMTFQVAVAAGLLDGTVPLVSSVSRVAPDGYGDVDVEFSDDSRALVQVKERSLTGRFGRSHFSEALSGKKHILMQHPDCRFVLATNAILGPGLAPTGWGRSRSDCLSQSYLETLVEHIADDFDDPHEILPRCHVVQVDWDVVEGSRANLAYFQRIHPSVAALAYSMLLEQITEVTLRQRSATRNTVKWIAVSDPGSLVRRVVESVDVDNLDEAFRLGIIEPVDFSVRSALTMEEFRYVTSTGVIGIILVDVAQAAASRMLSAGWISASRWSAKVR